MKIRIPKYSLSEELINSISHGLGSIFAIVALILMLVKSHTPMEYVTISIFGTSLIILYTISCIYHALSPKLTGKKSTKNFRSLQCLLISFRNLYPHISIRSQRSFRLDIVFYCNNYYYYRYSFIIRCHR